MRKGFASTPSLLAMAALLAAAPMAARAQSFNATGTIVAGAGAILNGPGTTTVSADAANLVINWTPTDTAIGGGPINFQNAGTVADFANRDATTLNVLNRILPNDPTRAVVFNGTVTSRLVDLATGASSRGGTLFFYSPGGILVSSTGVFDVGNLALTASDLAFDTTTGVFGTAGTYSFLPANAGSRVEVRTGARITAGPISAYVALIAPKVINSGTINVDGSAVIVAADASTITFRPNGLFDIQIDRGTSATGEVVTNDGTITGPVGSINTAHRVYMVAVPRNDAITMAIKGGSSLGFDVAGAADIDGNAIVLSAGFNVTGGAIDAVRAKASSAAPAALALGAIAATSQVTGRATGQASLTVGAGETASFASNLDLGGVRDPAAATADAAFISVGGVGSTLDLKGNLQLTALDGGAVAASGLTDSGGASVTVDGGTLTVGGTATVSSSRTPDFAVDAAAGNATVTARGGAKVDFAQDLTISADATGRTRQDTPPGPNTGTGGTARLGIESGSAVTVGRSLVLSANGTGGSVTLAGLEGAAGTGGMAVIEGKADGGTLVVTGSTLLDARGFGGAGLNCAACAVEGGAASGGTASLIAAKGANFTFGYTVSVDASAFGGSATTASGKDGGAAQGGSAFVRSSGGQITVAQSLVARAEATGGTGASFNNLASGAPGSGGTGGSGTGGTASISAGDAGSIGGGGLISALSDTLVSTVGRGGTGGNGGAGVGGTAAVSARNGTVSGSALTVFANGIGGSSANGGTGGAGQGASAEVIAYSALEGDAKVTFSGASVSARGDGGNGSSPAFFDGVGSAGGNGTGGSVRVLAQAGNGALSLGESSLDVSSSGGIGGNGFTVASVPVAGLSGGAGGVGRAGTAQFGVVSGLDTGATNTGSATAAALSVSAHGTGGTGGAPSAGASSPGAYGNGGDGYGGGTSLVAQGGKVTLTAAAFFDAGGTGGSTGLGGTAGDGFVGDAGAAPVPLGARLEVGSRTGHPAQQGSLVATDLSFVASAETGKGGTPGNGTILGRPLAWLIGGGTIDAGNLSFLAAGTPTATAPASDIALAGGTVTLTGDLTFTTPGSLTATLDGMTVRAVNATLSAADWLEGLVPSGTVGTLFGSGSVALNTTGNLFGHLSANSAGALTLTSATGLVRLDDLTAVGDINVTAATTVSLGNVQAGGSAVITAPGNVTVGNVGAVGSATVGSQVALVTGGVVAGQSIDLEGVDSIAAGGTIQAGDSVLLNSDGIVGAGAISAGVVAPSALSGARYSITVFGRRAVAVGDLAARGDIALLSQNTVSSGAIAGNEVAVLASGDQSLGGITATGRVLLADYAMAGSGGPLTAFSLPGVFAATPVIASEGSISLTGASGVGQLTAAALGSIVTQDVTATAAGAANGTINLQADLALGTGALIAGGRIDLTSGTTMTVGSASAGDALAVNAGGALTAGGLSAAAALTVIGGDAITATGLAGASVLATAATSLSGGTVNATGGTVTLTSANDLSTSPITATGTITLTSTAGGIAVGNLTSTGGDATLTAVNTLSAGSITASGPIALTSSAGGVTAGALTSVTSSITATSAGAMDIVSANAATIVSLTSGGVLTAGDLAGVGGVTVTGPGAVTTGLLTATGGDVLVTATGDLATGAVTADGLVTLTSTAGTLSAGDVRAIGGAVTLGARNAASAGNVHAATDVLATSGGTLRLASALSDTGSVTLRATGGDVRTGDLVAATTVRLSAAGNVAVGDASAGQSTVELRTTGGSLTAGAITAATDTALIATGDLAVGAVQARDIALLGGGNLSAAALSSQNGRILAASNSLGLAGGAIGAFDFNAVFAQPLVAAGGGLTLTGAVSGATTFAAAVNGDARTQGIAASSRLSVDAGGAARLGGVWQSPVIQLRASDLDLPAGSGLNAGVGGTITLVSRNPAGMRIGDGLDGSVVPTSGFSIDNAEWSRINSGSLSVSAPDVAGPVDILIGKLDVTGPDAGSTIDDPQGIVQFTTGATAAGTFSGTIRVVGALRTRGFRATNALDFRTGLFQLAADTGSIAVEGIGGALSGTLSIDARDIHVAASSLLAPLAANPFFAGVEPALDQVSAGGNGPVLQANAFAFTVGRSLYVQRTGNGFDPLGFEVPLNSLRVRQAGAAPIALIINGTFRTATGLVSGAEAWRQFKASDFNFGILGTDSRLNGCLLNAAICSVRLEPDPGIRTVIDWVDKPKLDDTPLDPENPLPLSKDAIVPPPLLLPVQPDALPGQVDEPIAGSGNPALIAPGGQEGARP